MFRCVFIELLTDGDTPFDLSQMLAFRENRYNPNVLLDKIECKYMRVS